MVLTSGWSSKLSRVAHHDLWLTVSVVFVFHPQPSSSLSSAGRIHMHARTHTHMHTHACRHTYTRTHAHIHTHMHARTHTHTHACTYTHTHVYTQLHLCSFTAQLDHTKERKIIFMSQVYSQNTLLSILVAYRNTQYITLKTLGIVIYQMRTCITGDLSRGESTSFSVCGETSDLCT